MAHVSNLVAAIPHAVMEKIKAKSEQRADVARQLLEKIDRDVMALEEILPKGFTLTIYAHGRTPE